MKVHFRRASALIISIGLLAGATSIARAQVSRALTVAVLTFGNSSGYGGNLLGTRASAASETALIESGRYDVVKRDLVNKTLSDLNLSYPLGTTGIVQLAQALEADDVITGDVQKVFKDKTTNQVHVTLRMEMTDRSSGELVNGSIVTGDSGVRPDFSGSEDVLLDEALSKAAFEAVRSMNDRILPEGTVYSTSSEGGVTEVLLNIGSNSGVQPNMEFIVLRNREQVGRLRASTVSPTDTVASVVSTTRGVQPEDKVRAVFRLENIPVDQHGSGSVQPVIHRSHTNIGGTAVGLAALFGLISLTKGKGGGGIEGARSATAQSTGPFNGAPAADATPYVPIIHIKWKKPIGILDSDILGYAISDVNDEAETFSITSAGINDTYRDGIAFKGTLTIGPGSGSGTTTTTLTTQSDGLIAGVPTVFNIRTYYNHNTTDPTTGTVTSTILTSDTQTSGPATGIEPPDPVGTTGSDITNLGFQFELVPGADRFCIQVADNPSFNSADEYPKDGNGQAFSTLPPALLPYSYYGTTAGTPDQAGSTLFGSPDVRDPSIFGQINVNLQTGNINPNQTGITLYWRAGAKNSRDAVAPENGGFVWSNFTTLALPGSVTAVKPYVPVARTGLKSLLGAGSGPILPTGTPQRAAH